MLKLAGISKRYGTAVALHPFTLEVPEGRTTVLIGPSGCGKSTVLRLIIGLAEADSGEVLVHERPVTRAGLPGLRHRTGYVIQDGGLFPHLTAAANVCLLPGHLGWMQDDIEQRIAYLTRLLQLPPDILQRFPAELSGGQRQRISLMRALMPDPELLLLDEPMGALDPMIRFELQQELRSVFRQLHKTVILVTHDMAEAAYLGDLIVLMRGGCLVQQGELQQLLSNPAEPFVERFISAQREPWRAFAGEPV